MGTETNANYKLVMKDFVTSLFPPKALQLQKRYLLMGMYRPPNKKLEYSYDRYPRWCSISRGSLPLRLVRDYLKTRSSS